MPMRKMKKVRIATAFLSGVFLFLFVSGLALEGNLYAEPEVERGEPTGLNESKRLKYALQFDGEKYVEIPHSSSLDITEEISFGAWIKVDEFDASWQAIMGKGDHTYQIRRDGSANNLRAEIRGGDGGNVSVSASTDVSDGEWYHAFAVYDGSEVRIYINGNEEGSVGRSGTIGSTTGDLLIGANYDGSYRRYWKGKINDVRIYDRALNEDEISDLHEGEEVGETGLVGHWPLNHRRGDVAKDLAEGNNGKLVGHPSWTFADPFAEDLEHKDAERGETVTLGPVELRGPEGEVTYQWYRDDKPIDGATEDSFTIEDFTSGDLGTYHVEADDERELTPVSSIRVTFHWPMWHTTAAPGEIRLWSYPVLDNALREAHRFDRGPVRIEGARNGTFSGAVAVESTESLTGLRATLEPADREDGRAMPACASEEVKVRYAVRWEGGGSLPSGLDVLLEEPPEEVETADGRALVGVWITVDVSEDMAEDLYHGDLRIEADGLEEPRTVPVELNVSGWRVPEPKDWETIIEMMQSPDTLALEYDVELWSDEHFELIGESFRRIRKVGSKMVYVPLIRESNQGNEESMVRWVEQPDGSFAPDYRVMERYLDVAQENLDEIDMVVFYAWDIYLGGDRDERPEVNPDSPRYGQRQQRKAQRRWDAVQEGLTVTMLDPQTGETEPGHLPHYLSEGSRELWRPVYDELRRRMRERGLEEAMTLGALSDAHPSREEVVFFNEVTGNLPWMSHAHPPRIRNNPAPNTALRGIASIEYAAFARPLHFSVNPEIDRQHGWTVPEKLVYLCRFGQLNGHPLLPRLLLKTNITSRQRGLGRLGGDYWSVIRDSRGRRSGMVHARYPHNHWRGLNINSYFLAPGPDGPIGTARFENLREEAQQSEARIFIENALQDDEKRERIGDELAGRARELLDERQMAAWMAAWPDREGLEQLGTISGRSLHEAIWGGLREHDEDLPGFWDGEARRRRGEMGPKGRAWFVESGWLDRNARLFELAEQVQERLAP